MSDDPFVLLESTIDQNGAEAAFDKLAGVLREQKKYPQLFEALLMKKRHELGLPLQGTESISDLPEEIQVEVETYYIEACREVGGLFLEDKNISGAWPYFRAIDEPKKVAAALDTWKIDPSTEDEDQLNQLDEIVEIALTQGANPRRGYDLVLDNYGVCRAITIFEHQFPYKGDVRESCGLMLIHRLYGDLVENVRSDVESRREAQGESKDVDLSNADVRTLIEGREWLFEGFGYHVDISHLQSVIRIGATMKDKDGLEKAIQMAEYGRNLGRDFQHPDPAPFEDFYNDYRIFLRAVKGEGIDGAVRYFTQKAERYTPDEEGRHFPGEVLVHLLDRLGRHDEAIEAFLKYLKDLSGPLSVSPELSALCDASGDYTKLLETAKEKDDLLQFAAGLVSSRGVVSPD